MSTDVIRLYFVSYSLFRLNSKHMPMELVISRQKYQPCTFQRRPNGQSRRSSGRRTSRVFLSSELFLPHYFCTILIYRLHAVSRNLSVPSCQNIDHREKASLSQLFMRFMQKATFRKLCGAYLRCRDLVGIMLSNYGNHVYMTMLQEA